MKIQNVFVRRKLTYDTVSNVLYQLFVTFCLGISSTTASGSERSVLCMPVSARSSIYFRLPEDLWDIYPNTFSGGERLRLNLAHTNTCS